MKSYGECRVAEFRKIGSDFNQMLNHIEDEYLHGKLDDDTINEVLYYLCNLTQANLYQAVKDNG